MLFSASTFPRLRPQKPPNKGAVRTCVIFNPTAKGDKARRFRRHLDEIAAESTLKQTSGVGDARRLAAEAVREGFEVVVAAGGDGTMNEVLNGMGDVPDGFQRARFGVLPLGTVNVFARELGIPTRLERAWQTIRDGHDVAIDLGYVEYFEKGAPARRYFAQLAGAGLDARAIELVHWPLKKKIGPLAYVVAGLKALLQRQSEITVTDGEHSATGELVLIGNGRFYGGPFAVFPQAGLRDGVLDVRVFRRINWTVLARRGPALLLRKTLAPEATANFRSGAFTLNCTRPTPLEVDGEAIGHLPAKFLVRGAAVRVRVSEVRDPGLPRDG